MMRFTATGWMVLALCLASPSIALAQTNERANDLAAPTVPAPSEFSLDISAMTLLPLVIGGMVGFEVPGHVVMRVGAGFVSSAYVDALNSVAMDQGAYDGGSAQLASLLLNDATVLELGLGVRPWGTPGIELDVSYALLWSHRRIDMAQLGGSLGDAGLDLTIDAVHAELAWQTEPADFVYFRVAVGWAQAFDHHVSVAGAGDAATQTEMHTSADALASAVGRHAFGPTLGASLGVRF
jgi:hypothetical protein